MRKSVYLSLLSLSALFLSSCAVHNGLISNREARKNNQSIQKANSEGIAGYTPYTSLTYIDRFKTIAIQEMNLYGIPASITLGAGAV